MAVVLSVRGKKVTYVKHVLIKTLTLAQDHHVKVNIYFIFLNLKVHCGDGIMMGGEECDDGN